MRPDVKMIIEIYEGDIINVTFVDDDYDARKVQIIINEDLPTRYKLKSFRKLMIRLYAELRQMWRFFKP